MIVQSSIVPSPTFTLVRPSSTPTPTPIPIHVGDIDRTSISVNRTTWRARATIRVHRSNETNMQGVSVTGRWSHDGSTGLCVTNSNGLCDITSSNLSRSNNRQVTFTVTNLTHSLAVYNPDSDGSNGTSIIISRP